MNRIVFCACASISLSIQYINHYFFFISKTGILQCKTAQVLRDGYGEYISPRTATLQSPCPAWETIPLSFVRGRVPRAQCGHTAFFLDRQGKRANAKQVHCFHCREVEAHEKAIVAYCNNTMNLQQHLCTWHPEVLTSTSSSQTTRRIVTVYSRQCFACR